MTKSDSWPAGGGGQRQVVRCQGMFAAMPVGHTLLTSQPYSSAQLLPCTVKPCAGSHKPWIIWSLEQAAWEWLAPKFLPRVLELAYETVRNVRAGSKESSQQALTSAKTNSTSLFFSLFSLFYCFVIIFLSFFFHISYFYFLFLLYFLLFPLLNSFLFLLFSSLVSFIHFTFFIFICSLPCLHSYFFLFPFLHFVFYFFIFIFILALFSLS